MFFLGFFHKYLYLQKMLIKLVCNIQLHVRYDNVNVRGNLGFGEKKMHDS